MAKEEEKVEVFNEFLENNRINTAPKTPTKKEPPLQKVEEDPKLRIEEIKKQLAHKIDFSEVNKGSPIVNKKVSKPSGKTQLVQKNEPGKNPYIIKVFSTEEGWQKSKTAEQTNR